MEQNLKKIEGLKKTIIEGKPYTAYSDVWLQLDPDGNPMIDGDNNPTGWILRFFQRAGIPTIFERPLVGKKRSQPMHGEWFLSYKNAKAASFSQTFRFRK